MKFNPDPLEPERMNAVYQIADWDRHFESSRSREIERPARLYLPNKQDGQGFARVIKQPDGVTIFGLWTLIAQACSRQRSNKHQQRDGWLTDDGTATGTPWDAEDLALRWGLPVELVERGLATFCGPKVGWMRRHQVEVGIPTSGRNDAATTVCRSGADQVPTNCRSTADAVRTNTGEVRTTAGDPDLEAQNATERGAEADGDDGEKGHVSSLSAISYKSTADDLPTKCRPSADAPPTEQNRNNTPPISPMGGGGGGEKIQGTSAGGKQAIPWDQARGLRQFAQLRAVVSAHLAETTWDAWQRLIRNHGWSAVIAVCEALPPDRRWPNHAETALLARPPETTPEGPEIDLARRRRSHDLEVAEERAKRAKHGQPWTAKDDRHFAKRWSLPEPKCQSQAISDTITTGPYRDHQSNEKVDVAARGAPQSASADQSTTVRCHDSIDHSESTPLATA